MSYQAIELPAATPEADRREPRRVGTVFASTLLAAGALALVARGAAPAAGAPLLRAASSTETASSPTFLTAVFVGSCTEWEVQDAEMGDDAPFLCTGESEDGEWSFTSQPGAHGYGELFKGNMTMTSDAGSITMSAHGKYEKEHGIDDLTSAYGTMTGRILDATGEYAGCQGSATSNIYYSSVEFDDDGDHGDDDTAGHFSMMFSTTVMYEWA